MVNRKTGKKKKYYKFIAIVLGVFLLLLTVWVYLIYQQVSKRGEKIVFVEEGNIKVADIDGSNVVQLTERKFEQLKNAKRTFGGIEIKKNEEVDVSNSYFENYFGETMGISPDGRFLAATSYNRSIKESIESNDNDFQRKYLTGTYWNPHYQMINIFDLKKKKLIKSIDMEEKLGQNLAYINRIVWSPKNSHITVFSQSGNYKIDIKKETVVKISDINTISKSDFADLPGVRTIYYIDWGLGFKQDTIIHQMYIGGKTESPKVLFTIPNEKILIHPQGGLNNNMFFVTYAGEELKLYEYQPFKLKPLSLIKAWKPDINVSKNFQWYYAGYRWSINPISPSGKYIRFYNEENEEYFFYNVTTGEVNSNLEQIWKTGETTKWSLDGSKVVYCLEKTLYEYSIGDSSKKELMNFKGSCPNTLHINYIN